MKAWRSIALALVLNGLLVGMVSPASATMFPCYRVNGKLNCIPIAISDRWWWPWPEPDPRDFVILDERINPATRIDLQTLQTLDILTELLSPVLKARLQGTVHGLAAGCN
jgi:hypothetical protein